MSEPPELWVLVDNTNTGILYSNGAEWTPTTNVVDAFEQTATSTTVSGATLSYHFNGSKVALFSPFSTLNISHQTAHPLWECFVDDKSISTNNSFTNFPIQSLCEADNLNNQEHVISLQVGTSTALGGDVPLYFDYLKYLPLDGASASSDAIISASSTSLQSKLGPDWNVLGKTNAAFTTGSSTGSAIFIITFTGTSLEWYGLSTSALSQATLNTGFALQIAPNSFNYTLDMDSDNEMDFFVEFGGEPVTVSSYNNMLFQTPQLPSGSHNLTIFFAGGPTRTPLTLDYLAFFGSSASFPSLNATNALPGSGPTIAPLPNSLSTHRSNTPPSSPTDGSLPSSTSPSSITNSSTVNPGAESHKRDTLPSILGGTLGGIAAMTFVAILFLHIFHRRKRRINNDLPVTTPRQISETQIYATHVRPFRLGVDTANLDLLREKNRRSDNNQIPSSSRSQDSTKNENMPSTLDVRQGKRQRLSGSLIAGNSRISQDIQMEASTPRLQQINAEPLRISSAHALDSLEVGRIQEATRRSASVHVIRPDTNFSARRMSSRSSGKTPERVVRHEDSGVRLRQGEAEESASMLELPPNYTPY